MVRMKSLDAIPSNSIAQIRDGWMMVNLRVYNICVSGCTGTSVKHLHFLFLREPLFRAWDLALQKCTEARQRGSSLAFQRALDILDSEYRAWARFYGYNSKLDRLTPELLNLKSELGVHLSGKCSAVRTCTAWLLHAVAAHDDGSDWARARIGCIWGLFTYYDVLYRNGRYLPDPEIDLLIFAATVSTESYYWLRSECIRLHGITQTTSRRFRPKPKNHQWIHLVEDRVKVTKINPRFEDCYMNEDFVGQMKKNMQACHRVS